jgi:hypothetical protein
VDVYFPYNSGPWVHLWGGNVVSSTSENVNTEQKASSDNLRSKDMGIWLTVPAGIGYPPVFFKQSSLYGQQLRDYIIQKEYNTGYYWEYNNVSI